ncbi:hypothetical protein DSO57_1037760 [Entomophthora muscae]|uniref:Uncharacterized protein n=1 Tax=Entomophthora muscae TaxID=34485 RepID=A0ACC2SYY9_9FUNG|nr:hypothetical protein DSO57_1037760 [Entomophthora muscae]
MIDPTHLGIHRLTPKRNPVLQSASTIAITDTPHLTAIPLTVIREIPSVTTSGIVSVAATSHRSRPLATAVKTEVPTTDTIETCRIIGESAVGMSIRPWGISRLLQILELLILNYLPTFTTVLIMEVTTIRRKAIAPTIMALMAQTSTPTRGEGLNLNSPPITLLPQTPPPFLPLAIWNPSLLLTY